MTSSASSIAICAALDPFAQQRISFKIKPGMTLREIARRAVSEIAHRLNRAASAFDWFFDVGVIRVSGRLFGRDEWGYTKPRAGTTVELCVPTPGKGGAGKLLLVLAAVALSVVTAGIAGGGIAAAFGLGASSTFAAGGLGASLLAAGVGIAGQLALNALTPPPSPPSQQQNKQLELSIAGIQGNALTRDAVLARVIGRMRVSPQILWPSHTTLNNEKMIIHAMVGVDGDCNVSNIRINDMPIEAIQNARWEVKEGDGAAGDTYLSQSFRIQKQLRLSVENFKTEDAENIAQNLLDQVTPTNSYSPTFDLPSKHADAKGFTIRHVFPNGIIVEDGTQAKRGGVAVRYQAKRVGDSTWKNLPVLHFESKKTFGPFQQDVSFVFGDPPGGYNIAINYESHTKFAFSKTGVGQSFSYESDPYFFSDIASPPSIYTDFTTYTNGTMTVSASSEKSGSEAWRAFNGSGALGWSPADNSLPAWLQIDFGVGQTRTLRSFGLNYANILTAVKSCRIEGRLLPGDPWTVLFDSNNRLIYGPKDVLPPTANGFPSKIMACRQIRLVVTENNGAANNEVLLADFFMSETFANPSAIDASGNFTTASGLAGTAIAARHVYLTRDGATVFLRPEQWPDGQYEFRIRRSWAYNADKFNAGYVYDSAPGNASFFTHIFTSGFNRTYENQKKIRSDLEVSLISEDYGFRAIRQAVEHRLTRIAVSIPGLEIQSISALFNGKARVWNGTGWTDQAVPTRYPAAWYRDGLLRVEQNATPLPGEVLDENSMEAFYTHCETNGITCDALVQGRSVADVCSMLASVARAAPRNGNMWAVTIDHDRSAEAPVALITPETSRDGGTEKIFEDIPHALRVSYLDEADDYKLKDVTVYRPGFDVNTATLIEAFPPYDGITNEADAIARAEYDFGQMLYRNVTYTREVGIEGLTYGKGDLVSIADDVIQRSVHYGLVKNVLKSGGNVTGFELYGEARLSESFGQLGLEAFGVQVRRVDGQTFTAAITNTADTDTVTLVTPVADTGQFGPDQPIAIGELGRVTTETVVHRVEPIGGEEFRVVMLPVGNQIFQ